MTKELNLEFFINAVEENNIINDSDWTVWRDSKEIIDVYTDNLEDYEFSDYDYIVNRLDLIIESYRVVSVSW